VNSPISLLLSLQDKDIKLAAIRAKLKSAPLEINSLNAEIAKIEARYEQFKVEFTALKTKASDMRAQRKAIEEKIIKYRKQLLETKKNDDYLALNAEINKMTESVSNMESEELQMMMDIDSGKETLEAHRAECTSEIDILNGKIWAIKEQLARLESDCEFAAEQSAEAESKVSEVFLHAYKQIKKSGKKFPIVVKFDGVQCCGCYLKTSGNVIAKFEDAQQPVLCEQCGRIMYK